MYFFNTNYIYNTDIIKQWESKVTSFSALYGEPKKKRRQR
jgi:hypothetical protein